jgi:DNA-directed RNA polymerase specialized sigma24 family protein
VAQDRIERATRTSDFSHNYLTLRWFWLHPEPNVVHVLNLVLSYHSMDIAISMPERAVRMKVRTLSRVMEGRSFNLLRLKYVEGLTDARIGELTGMSTREVHRARTRAERHLEVLLAGQELILELEGGPDAK